MNGGARVKCGFDAGAVGQPMVRIELPAAKEYRVSVEWRGRAAMAAPTQKSYRVGDDALETPAARDIDDADRRSPGVSYEGKDRGQRASYGVCECARGRLLVVDADLVYGEGAAGGVRLCPGVAYRREDAAGGPFGSAEEPGEPIFTRVYAEPRSPYCSLAIPDTMIGGWANPDGTARIDDAGLRAAGGLLRHRLESTFPHLQGSAPNCVFLSYWKQDESSMKVDAWLGWLKGSIF